jgi:L-amino acid ligase
MPPSRAIVVIDPVSSGAYLKAYLQDPDILAVAVYTLTDAQLAHAGKALPWGERHRGWGCVIDGRYPSTIFAMLRSLGTPIVGVIAGSEPGVALAELLADALGLPGNPAGTTALRRDKGAMRMATSRAGLANPRFQICRGIEQAVAFGETCHYPVMVKALSSAGTDHVYTCHTADEVASAARRALGATDIFGAVLDAVIVEEFVEGTQYVVEVLAHAGGHLVTSVWAIEERSTPEWAGMFHRIPLLRDGATCTEIADLRAYAIDVCRALEIRVGPALVEVRRHPTRGPVLIEAGARLSGLDAPKLVAYASTLDPFRATIDLLTGAVTALPSRVTIQRSVVLVFVPIAESGRVAGVEGLTEIRALPSFYDGKVAVKPGATVRRTCDQASFAARFVLAHEDPAQVAHDETRLRELFQVRFAPIAMAAK